jgi:hypothetical protein
MPDNQTIRPAECAPEAAGVRGGIPFSVLALTVTPKSTLSSAPFVDHHVPPNGLEEINRVVAELLESAALAPSPKPTG